MLVRIAEVRMRWDEKRKEERSRMPWVWNKFRKHIKYRLFERRKGIEYELNWDAIQSMKLNWFQFSSALHVPRAWVLLWWMSVPEWVWARSPWVQWDVPPSSCARWSEVKLNLTGSTVFDLILFFHQVVQLTSSYLSWTSLFLCHVRPLSFSISSLSILLSSSILLPSRPSDPPIQPARYHTNSKKPSPLSPLSSNSIRSIWL